MEEDLELNPLMTKVHKVQAWIKEQAAKKQFVVLAQGFSASGLYITTTLYKESHSDLNVSINLALQDLTDHTEEHLMTSILPHQWGEFLKSYQVVRKKHWRKKREGKEGLMLSSPDLPDMDGSQVQTTSDGYVR